MQPSSSPSPPNRLLSLTQASLAQLQIAEEIKSRPSRWSFQPSTKPFASSSRVRVPSVTPSSTSISDGEDNEEMGMSFSEETVDWKAVGKLKAKGKGKEKANLAEGKGRGLLGTLPPEILVQIFRQLPPQDIPSVVRVSKTWSLLSYSLIWHKPNLTSMTQLIAFLRVLESPNQSLPYSTTVRRINLLTLADQFTDDLFSGLRTCTRIERLTAPGLTLVTSRTLRKVLSQMPLIMAIDLSKSPGVNNAVVRQIAETCRKLQGMNLTGCDKIEDEGLLILAKKNKIMRRIKLAGCTLLTDTSLVALIRNSPLVLEIDLANIPQLSNPTLYAIWIHSSHLRDLKFNGNTNLISDAIPNLPELMNYSGDEATRNVEHYPCEELLSISSVLLRPAASTFEHLRTVDFTECSGLSDLGVDHLVTNAPKLRGLTLAKCPHLTDASLISISRLGKNLHHLHLAHLSEITDAAVTQLARACTRLRYIDVACCSNLTDLSVFELASNLPKLRRIGLVKVRNLTDEGIYALVERQASLERIHLSYCPNISVKAITFLLNRLLRLNHLSLTGIAPFKTPELQQFCRPVPDTLTESQTAAFCVYSGHGVAAVRNYLNTQQALNTAGSDTNSTHHDSDSSTSSITFPGPPSPPARHRHTAQVNRRVSVPAFRENTRRQRGSTGPDSVRQYHPPRSGSGSSVGVPSSAFLTTSPNFLAPAVFHDTRTSRTGSTFRSARGFGEGSGSVRGIEDVVRMGEERVMPGMYRTYNLTPERRQTELEGVERERREIEREFITRDPVVSRSTVMDRTASEGIARGFRAQASADISRQTSASTSSTSSPHPTRRQPLPPPQPQSQAPRAIVQRARPRAESHSPTYVPVNTREGRGRSGSDLIGLGTSPLRWVADIVGWGVEAASGASGIRRANLGQEDEDEEDEEVEEVGPRGERH